MNHTYFNLMSEKDRQENLTPEFIGSLKKIDYNSPVFKINLIVKTLPKFTCLNKIADNFSDDSNYESEIAREYFPGTIHMNSENIKTIDDCYIEALSGIPSTKPIVEMTIPSILDKSLVPENSGHHVVSGRVRAAGQPGCYRARNQLRESGAGTAEPAGLRQRQAPDRR